MGIIFRSVGSILFGCWSWIVVCHPPRLHPPPPASARCLSMTWIKFKMSAPVPTGGCALLYVVSSVVTLWYRRIYFQHSRLMARYGIGKLLILFFHFVPFDAHFAIQFGRRCRLLFDFFFVVFNSAGPSCVTLFGTYHWSPTGRLCFFTCNCITVSHKWTWVDTGQHLLMNVFRAFHFFFGECLKEVYGNSDMKKQILVVLE